MTNKMHNFYNQFLFHSFLSALNVSNESNRSSSAARHNVLYYTVWYSRYNRAGESSCYEAAWLACTIVPNCVIQYTKQCSWRWTTRFVRNMYSKAKRWNKRIINNNCASRWLSTRCLLLFFVSFCVCIYAKLQITKKKEGMCTVGVCTRVEIWDIWSIHLFFHSCIHSVVCLAAGPQPLP